MSREKKDKKEAAKKTAKATRTKPALSIPATHAQTRRTCPSSSSPSSPLNTPKGIFRSANCFLNFHLPLLTERYTEDEPDAEPLVSAAPSDWGYRPRTSTAHSAPGKILNISRRGTRPRSSKQVVAHPHIIR